MVLDGPQSPVFMCVMCAVLPSLTLPEFLSHLLLQPFEFLTSIPLPMKANPYVLSSSNIFSSCVYPFQFPLRVFCCYIRILASFLVCLQSDAHCSCTFLYSMGRQSAKKVCSEGGMKTACTPLPCSIVCPLL
ncbi:hypothetical protein BDW67DRAFT_84658 [Aspergillus spinulosporus]